jgi:hypothetical protein
MPQRVIKIILPENHGNPALELIERQDKTKAEQKIALRINRERGCRHFPQAGELLFV